MPKKKINKPSDVEQAAPQKSVIEEAGLDPNQWQVVDAPSINPNQPSGVSPAPVNNSLSSGPLPPNFGYQPALVNTTYPASTGPIGLMPIQGGPQFNSKSIGVTRTVIEQGTGGSGSGSIASPIITLETNGAMNPNQSVLNLIGGANVGLTSDAGGGVTFASEAHEIVINGVAAPGTTVNLNNTTPAPPSGKTNVLFQADGASPTTGVSAYMPLVVGDSGAGGVSGAVPAPPSGSAAANKFFKADATFAVPPNMVGDSGSGGVAGYVPAPSAGSAAAGKFLKADGTFAVPPGTGGAANYQTVQDNGSPLTVQPVLNFITPFVATNNGGNTSTDITITSIQAYATQPLSGDVAITASTITVVDSIAVTFPAAGGPWRVFLSYSYYWNSGGTPTANFFITDTPLNVFGGTQSAGTGSLNSNGNSWAGYSPVTYANGATITFTVKCDIDHTATVKELPAIAGCKSNLEYSIFTSN